ncbi:MAG: hypothetical protein Q9166_006102 [cf. Caloplaca sp. 2 TL-2023]
MRSTPSTISVPHGITEIFRSGTKGIVAAKRASKGSGILAVADDQLVVLHDVRKGMQKSYRLRSADGGVRMLRYARDANRLFFTTTLQNAVQTYDLEHSRLLDPAYDHPSPPTVFALSSTSHLLLSASASPSVIQLTNLLLGTRPLLLRPQCSSAAVVVVEFHPERGNIFILAFTDSTCAVYDAAYIFRDGGKGGRRSGASASGSGWEIAHIKRLHASGKDLTTTVGGEDGTNIHTLDSSGYASVGNRNVGIMAAAFIPGYKATTITVGSDGDCCLVDFTASEAGAATLIRSWHVAGAATCLSVLAPGPREGSQLPIAGPRDPDPDGHTAVVAIGRRDGKILFFDLKGNLLLVQALFQGGPGIIDVEWMEGDDWPEPVKSRISQGSLHKKKSAVNRKSLGSVLAGHRPVAEEVVAIVDDAEANDESSNVAVGPSTDHDPGGTKKENEPNNVDIDIPMRYVIALNTLFDV